MLFGPDGRLYVGMGDGGGAFDPREKAQDPRSLLGKLIAADVDGSGRPRWEIVLTGLRNPWRVWFDPAMTEVWIGDVGQDRVEEVDRVPLEPDEPAKNLGWPAYEGGLIYRGSAIPELTDRYVFGDFCSGRLWTLVAAPAGRVREVRAEAARLPQLTHIGADARGELLFATADGKVFGATRRR